MTSHQHQPHRPRLRQHRSADGSAGRADRKEHHHATCTHVAHGSDGTTLIHGPVTDQAALHGLLQKIRDLGLPLISVNHVDPGHPPAPAAEAR